MHYKRDDRIVKNIFIEAYTGRNQVNLSNNFIMYSDLSLVYPCDLYMYVVRYCGKTEILPKKNR